jgi:alanine-synthesizing transaminase
VPYDLNESANWEPDVDQLAASVDKSTRAIVVINPNNPTGAVYSRRTLEGIAEIARRHNLIILSDEIFDKLILDSEVTHIPMATVAPDIPVVTLGGLSKNYLVPGWRIGWGVVTGESSLVRNYYEGIYKLLRARLSASHPMQFAISAALDGPQDHLEVTTSKMRARRDLLMEWANASPHVSCVAPRAAFYAFPKLDIPDDDLTFVKGVLTEKDVLLVNGAGFGQKPGTRHIRIVYLPQEQILKQAFARMAEYIDEKYS